jgi:MarR family transcriptional regulator for hemolysin
VHLVELTAEGDALFDRLRAAAMAHDERVRAGLTSEEVDRLTELLDRIRDNLTEGRQCRRE